MMGREEGGAGLKKIRHDYMINMMGKARGGRERVGRDGQGGGQG